MGQVEDELFTLVPNFEVLLVSQWIGRNREKQQQKS